MKNQIKYVSDNEYLDRIIGVTEASKILDIAPGYLRSLILKGEFENWEFKKLGKNIILLKDSVERRKGKFKKYKKEK